MCLFALLKAYISNRGPALNAKEQFFVFADGSLVAPHHMRNTLKAILTLAGFNAQFYSTHSLCVGRTSDLLHIGLFVETIKKLGRWKSNAVFNYLR